jgi:hypothetical protein
MMLQKTSGKMAGDEKVEIHHVNLKRHCRMRHSLIAFDNMAMIAKCAGGAALALSVRRLEPTSSAVKAATEDNNQYNDNDK